MLHIILPESVVLRLSLETWVCKQKQTEEVKLAEMCIYKSICIFVHYVCVVFNIFSAVMSENYIVFIEQPIKLDLLKFMLYRIQGKSFHKCMKWEPHCDTIFHLVNRHTGAVRLPWLVEMDSLTLRSKRKKKTLDMGYCIVLGVSCL